MQKRMSKYPVEFQVETGMLLFHVVETGLGMLPGLEHQQHTKIESYIEQHTCD